MIRLWRKSLSIQFIGLTPAVLIISQAITFLISSDEYTKKFDAGAKAEAISRAVSPNRYEIWLQPLKL